MDGTVLWQRIEGAAIFAAGLWVIVATGAAGLPWWGAVLLFLAPDLSFAAYLLGPRVGAFGYNLVHLYVWGVMLLGLGTVSGVPLAVTLGALWIAHVGMDRMLGYGLKSVRGFGFTHLGPIGPAKRG